MLKRVTQLELENFVTDHAVETDPDSGANARALSAEEVRKRSLAARQTLADKLEHSGPEGDWSQTYHKLINAGWPWRMAAWVAWSSIPKSKRWPKTQDELAVDVLGLTSDRVIATWRKKFPALDQMIADLQADEMLEARADVFDALKQSASTPDYKHAPDRRIYLTMTGDYAERVDARINNTNKARTNLKDLSDAELDALSGDPGKVREFIEQLRAEEQEEPSDGE